jgi:hypothetical protein
MHTASALMRRHRHDRVKYCLRQNCTVFAAREADDPREALAQRQVLGSDFVDDLLEVLLGGALSPSIESYYLAHGSPLGIVSYDGDRHAETSRLQA